MATKKRQRHRGATKRKNLKRDGSRILALGIPMEERMALYAEAVRATASVMREESGIARIQAARELIHLFAPDAARMESENTSATTPVISFISPLNAVTQSPGEDSDPATDAG